MLDMRSKKIVTHSVRKDDAYQHSMRECVGNLELEAHFTKIFGRIREMNEEYMNRENVEELESTVRYSYVNFLGKTLYSNVRNDFRRIR